MARKQDSLTVRSMKAEIAQKAAKKSPTYTTPEVVHEEVSKVVNEASHTQPYTQPNRVVRNTENTVIQTACIQVVKEPFIKRMNSSNLTSVLNNSEIENLIADGIEPEQIADNLATLLPLYQAEGITPTSKTLMDGIRQLKADAR